MKFKEVVRFYEMLESTTKRLEMGDILVELIRDTPSEVVDKVLYLTHGKLFPDYKDVELGVADRLLIRSISSIKGVPEKKINEKLWDMGDLGELTQFFFEQKTQMSLMSFGQEEIKEDLSVEEVYSELLKIGDKKDKDSQSLKMDIIKGLLQRAEPNESKFITRILTKNMRLGVKDLSILEAISHLYDPGYRPFIQDNTENIEFLEKNLPETGPVVKDCFELLKLRKPTALGNLESLMVTCRKEAKDTPHKDKTKEVTNYIEAGLEVLRASIKKTRTTIEEAYDLSSDIGLIVVKLKKEGLHSLSDISLEAGRPIRSMLAERLTSIEEIINKMDGPVAFENKYDGLRMQVHITPEQVWLYSRGMENMTEQFQDVVEAVRAAFKGKEGVVDGECVPIDPATGEMLPFQFISRRARRKHELASSLQTNTLDDFEQKGFEDTIPVKLILFDCLQLNGEDMTKRGYLVRREGLSKAFDFNDKVELAEQVVTSNVEKAEDFFETSINNGCEGIVAKSTASDSIYKAGSRGFLWIKYKRDYKVTLGDSLDLVVVGAFYGHGRRKGVYGAFLMAAFEPETGMFETVCKLGTGFDDAALEDMFNRLNEVKRDDAAQDVRLGSNMRPDVHFDPAVILEVRAAEITHSPVHTCAYSILKPDSGLALRFPRYTGRLREDKNPEDCTTSSEVVSMYRSQGKTG